MQIINTTIYMAEQKPFFFFPKMGVTQGQTGQSLRNTLYCVLIAPSFRPSWGSQEERELAGVVPVRIESLCCTAEAHVLPAKIA